MGSEESVAALGRKTCKRRSSVASTVFYQVQGSRRGQVDQRGTSPRPRQGSCGVGTTRSRPLPTVPRAGSFVCRARPTARAVEHVSPTSGWWRHLSARRLPRLSRIDDRSRIEPFGWIGLRWRWAWSETAEAVPSVQDDFGSIVRSVDGGSSFLDEATAASSSRTRNQPEDYGNAVS